MSDAIAVSGDSSFAVSSRRIVAEPTRIRSSFRAWALVSRQADPAVCHTDAMQIFTFCMGDFYNMKNMKMFRFLLSFWRARKDSNS
jgi:hypothetical protein